MTGRRKAIRVDSLLQLRQRLDRLPCKSPERANQITAAAGLYGVSATTVYRALQAVQKPHAAHRADHGKPRLLPQAELEHYCELIAALKLRTTNMAGRHLSTGRAIELMEDHGVETVQGLVKAPKVLLRRRLSIVTLLVAAGPAPFVARITGRALPGRSQQRQLAIPMSPSDSSVGAHAELTHGAENQCPI